MAPRTKRKRYDEYDFQPATKLEKESWNGFCEIESEPALFNVMLREFGVKGVKVQEVVSLDEEMMAFLNKPIYGLIFLFRWQADDPKKQEASCPEGIWFANQTASNACASVALLNIVNNIPDIDLGEKLQHFKEFTMPFTPALRGDAINNFEFVKRVHNSFARYACSIPLLCWRTNLRDRKMDILNSDLQLKYEATSKKSTKKGEIDDSDSFHFIAFMPSMGQVWKFDGLDRQPQALGEYFKGDWLEIAKPNILDRMAAYEEDQIEFSILGLVQDPLTDLIQQLAVNVKRLEIVNGQLKHSGPEFESMLSEPNDTVMGPDLSFELTRTAIDLAISPSTLPIHSTEQLLKDWQKLRDDQRQLRIRIREEQQLHRADEDHATGRRYDYGPAVRTWLQFLARKRQLADLLQMRQ
ncbi:hypothetical protein N7495_009817 [Penicillium taxi]|uniref:uncharacterized protein n=1 Tax=Penicillium taxi TaxID=168475 RepID=UPI002544E1C8|nr:uncharacterized protein N7495_009817 [Penicillium taxi]KAJ5885307.1 hypothetical protein N7495_009817 [Penicillium taxi]